MKFSVLLQGQLRSSPYHYVKGQQKGGAIVSNRYAVSYITTGIFRIYLATGWAWTTYKFISSDQQKERLFDFLVFLLEAAD